MKIISNKKIDKIKWDLVLKKSTNPSPFQQYNFYEFLNKYKANSADVFAVLENNEYSSLVVVSIIKQSGLKSYFSSRGIIYGGPLITTKKSIDFLLNHINNYYKKKLIYIETRNYTSYKKYNRIFINNGFKYKPWLNFHCKTYDFELLKKNLSKSRLRQIKKAIKNGVSYKLASDEKQIIEFYQILSSLYKSKIKKPLFPVKFFLEAYRSGFAMYFLVFFKGKVIGGIMSPSYKNKILYEFYVCGLDKDFKNTYPSIIATWAALEYASKNSFKYFDFMGAGPPNKDYGVRDFKQRFGGELVEYGRYLNIFNPFLYKLGEIAIKILTKFR